MSRQSKRGRPDRRDRRSGRARARRSIPWLWLGAAFVALVALVFVVRSFELGAPGERVAVSGVGVHVPEGQTIPYDSYPPAGGPHWPSPAPWGASAAPVPDERAVHNLEHGGVVVSYNAIPDADLNKLRSLTLTYPRDRYNEVKLLIRPYEKIPAATFVLTAWGWRASFGAYDDAAVRAFLDAHLNRCCEAVP